MSDRLVSVEQQRDGRVFVVTYSKTVDGHRLIDGTPVVVSGASDAAPLGEAVVTGLQRSSEGKLPARDTGAFPPDADFLAWVGAPSFAHYSKGVRSVSVWAANGQGEDLTSVEVTPEANGGPRKGFTPMDGELETLQSPSAMELGQAVQAALRTATA